MHLVWKVNVHLIIIYSVQITSVNIFLGLFHIFSDLHVFHFHIFEILSTKIFCTFIFKPKLNLERNMRRGAFLHNNTKLGKFFKIKTYVKVTVRYKRKSQSSYFFHICCETLPWMECCLFNARNSLVQQVAICPIPSCIMALSAGQF